MVEEEIFLTLHSVLSVIVSWISSIFILYFSSDVSFKTFSFVPM